MALCFQLWEPAATQPASQPAAAIWGRALIDEFQNVGQIYGDVILTLCFKCVNWVDLPSNAA
jgi:hypothetical protein